MLRNNRTMTSCPRRGIVLAAGAALALSLGPALAADRAGPPFDPALSPGNPGFVHGHPVHRRHPPRHRIVERVPVIGPPVRGSHFWGYLPRNHNVPMYNEPPRREPAW